MRKSKHQFLIFIIALLLVSPFLQQERAVDSPETDQAKRQKIHEMYQAYKKHSFPNAPEVTVQELLQWEKKEKPILVDVRGKKERRVSAIPGAITLDELCGNKNEYLNRKIIVYCTIGYRSGKQVVKMRKKGWNAYNLVGGVLAWSHAGQLFSAPDGDSLRLHVYGKKWNLAPEKYKAVW